jgi:hypothetical protein
VDWPFIQSGAMDLFREGIGYIIEITPPPATRIVLWAADIMECKDLPIERVLKTHGRETAEIIGDFGIRVAVHGVRTDHQRGAAFHDGEGSILVEDKRVIRFARFNEPSGGKFFGCAAGSEQERTQYETHYQQNHILVHFFLLLIQTVIMFSETRIGLRDHTLANHPSGLVAQSVTKSVPVFII